MIAGTGVLIQGQAPPAAPDANALDQQVLAEAKRGSEIMANLTYLSDEIGPRLTGAAALTRASRWAEEKMKAYGLTDVRLEPWYLPEGWERGPATARLIEPNNGRSLSLASMGWWPGTNGKVPGNVVILNAEDTKDFAAYKGKLKGAIVLAGAPFQLLPLEEIDKPGLPLAFVPTKLHMRPFEEQVAFQKALVEFLVQEGAVALLLDAGKPFNLLFTRGGWMGKDRPSAVRRLSMLYVAHDHYAMLHRLAGRPAPARTRLELDVQNTFVGPLSVYNTVGEIKGSDKPDEFVVVGAHLDSWDLGQGTVDNGTGSVIVLEAARILAKCGAKPKRTIRFVLFTGEEQGLHGSAAYIEKHADEMPRISACLVHDNGTGKVTGIDVKHRPVVRTLLEEQLGELKKLGVTDFQGAFSGGSDHASFEKVGVPGLCFKQEWAGYRLSHHSQADTLERAREPELIQGAQVMAVTALRIANLDRLLPRDK
jgi:hypothetical protein